MSALQQRKDIRMDTSLKNIDLRNVPTTELSNIDLDCVDLQAPAPEFEPNRQYYFMAKLKSWFQEECNKYGRTLTYHVETFGCQMNIVTQKWGVFI